MMWSEMKSLCQDNRAFRLSILYFCLLCFILDGTDGQVSIPGKYPHSSFQEALNKTHKTYKLKKQFNLRSLRLANLENHHSNEKPPYKFGNAIPHHIDASVDGEWTLSANEMAREWRAVITSPGATTLSINFDQFYLPPGSKLFVIGRNQTLGAFIGHLNNKPSGEFSTQPVSGDVIILEYIETISDPDERAYARINPASRALKLVVGSVVHGFRKGLFHYQDSGHCNIDIACPQGNGLRDEMNSVGLLIADNGQRFCTGTLLNNPRQDGRQLFLTADHCAKGDTTNYIVSFDYQYSKCVSGGEPRDEEIPPMKTVQGLRLLARWDKSDFALFEILEPIPDYYNVFYAGWSRANVAPFNVSTIHYPSGDTKKISRFFGTCVPSSVKEGPRTYHWRVEPWTEGVTEHGSSGAALFDAHNRVVGHLHGGSSSCDHRSGHDNFGSLAVDWETAPVAGAHLRPFLDPDNQGILGMSGNYYKSQIPVGEKSTDIPTKKPIMTKVHVEYERNRSTSGSRGSRVDTQAPPPETNSNHPNAEGGSGMEQLGSVIGSLLSGVFRLF